MPLTRWQHLTLIATPAQHVVWEITSRGVLANVDTALAHEARLLKEKDAVTATIINHPDVAAILERKAAPLEAARAAAEIAAADRARYEADIAAIRGDRVAGRKPSRTIKSLGGKPKQVKVTKKLIALTAFNPGSSKQKAWLLYDELKLRKQFNKDDDGTSRITTDKKALQRLQRLSDTPDGIKPVIAAFREWEHIDQILGTFIRPVTGSLGGSGVGIRSGGVGPYAPTAAKERQPTARAIFDIAEPDTGQPRQLGGDRRDGGSADAAARPPDDATAASPPAPSPALLVHPTLHTTRIYSDIGLHRTATGRLASGSESGTGDKITVESDINSQNQPKSISDIYIPDPGHYFVQVDWSKLEWLLTLYFAGDSKSFNAAILGEDQHKRLASVIYGVSYADVTEEQRTLAKRGTHGINYGMGVGRLADEAGIDYKLARAIVEGFKAAFPRVAEWRERVVALAKKQCYLQTPYGWRRWYWGVPKGKEGEVYCFLPQATGADLCKLSLPPLSAAVKAVGGWLAGTTHDSFLAQMPESLDRSVSIKTMLAVVEKPRKLLGNTIFPATGKVGYNWKEVR